MRTFTYVLFTWMLFGVDYSCCQNNNCSQVFPTRTFCPSPSNNVTISCPNDFNIIIISGEILRAKRAGPCNESALAVDGDTCTIDLTSITTRLLQFCTGFQTCTVGMGLPANSLHNCDSYLGNLALSVTYTCLPRQNTTAPASTIAVGSFLAVDGQLVTVTGDSTSPLGGCAAAIHPGTQIFVFAGEFLKDTSGVPAGQAVSSCGQRLQLVNESSDLLIEICSKDSVLLLPCSPFRRIVTLNYVTDNPDVFVAYGLNFLAPFGSRLGITCPPMTTTTPAITTTTPTTTTTTPTTTTTTPTTTTTTPTTTTTTPTTTTTTPTTTTTTPTTQTTTLTAPTIATSFITMATTTTTTPITTPIMLTTTLTTATKPTTAIPTTIAPTTFVTQTTPAAVQSTMPIPATSTTTVVTFNPSTAISTTSTTTTTTPTTTTSTSTGSTTTKSTTTKIPTTTTTTPTTTTTTPTTTIIIPIGITTSTTTTTTLTTAATTSTTTTTPPTGPTTTSTTPTTTTTVPTTTTATKKKKVPTATLR